MQYIVIHAPDISRVANPTRQLSNLEKIFPKWELAIRILEMLSFDRDLPIVSPNQAYSIGMAAYNISFPFGRIASKESYGICRHSKTELLVKRDSTEDSRQFYAREAPLLDLLELVSPSKVQLGIPNLIYVGDPKLVATLESWKHQISTTRKTGANIFQVIGCEEGETHLLVNDIAVNILKTLGKPWGPEEVPLTSMGLFNVSLMGSRHRLVAVRSPWDIKPENHRYLAALCDQIMPRPQSITMSEMAFLVGRASGRIGAGCELITHGK